MTYSHILDILAVLSGSALAAYGFYIGRKIRLIKDIPTSKIRSVAMGLVEIKGRAVQKYPLESRIMKVPCVYFRFLIEVERRDQKGRASWHRVDGGESSNYFYAEDDTGKILVDPLGAEVILPYDYRFVDIKGTMFSSQKVRYTEWRIEPGEDVYVLGSVGKFRNEVISRRALLAQKIRELKADRQQMKALDTDGDGIVSPEEWDAAVKKLEVEAAAEELQAASSLSVGSSGDDIVIAAGGYQKTFIISDHSEKELCGKLETGMYASVFVGFCIIVVSIGSLLSRAGLPRLVPPVPWPAILSFILTD